MKQLPPMIGLSHWGRKRRKKREGYPEMTVAAKGANNNGIEIFPDHLGLALLSLLQWTRRPSVLGLP
jgi:hypothetical protein